MTTNDTTTPGREGVLALNAALHAAWNAHDAAAFMEPWEEDADHVNIFGDVLTGKAQIAAATVFIFTTMMANSRSDVVVRDVRFPHPDVAILDIDQTLSGVAPPPGPPGPPPPWMAAGRMLTRIKIVALRRGDRWTVASFQNTAVLPKG